MAKEQIGRIIVRVQPNAGQNAVVRFEDGILHIRIAALPVKGKANQTLIKFLSDVLGVSKSRLSIEKGATSRIKVIAIEGLPQEDVRDRIEALQA